MHRVLIVMCVTLLSLISTLGAKAQHTAMKTNLLYWGTATLNIDAEVKLAPKWTGELSVGYNPWSFSDSKKIKHIAIQPEVRYWLCAPFSGHFLAANLLYSHYNAGGVRMPLGIFKDLRDYRFQGDLGGIGVGYGYNFLLSDRWSLELEATLGVIAAKYKKYRCEKCGTLVDRGTAVRFMPTKLAVNLVYYLK